MPHSLYGPRLAAWIAENVPDGESWRSFAPRHGIEPTRLFAWRRGTTPSLEQIERVAQAFTLTRTQVLMIAGFVTARDASLALGEVQVETFDFDIALEQDDSLDGHGREVLRTVRKSLLARSDASVKLS